MPAESESKVHNKITVTTDNAARAEPAEPRLSANSALGHAQGIPSLSSFDFAQDDRERVERSRDAVSALVVANFATCCR